MAEEKWHDVGSAEDLAARPLQTVRAGATPIALSYRDGAFAAISGACNHVGGPLGEGRLDGDYVACPWHNWKFHHRTGEGEPGFEEDRVPSHAVKVMDGRVFVDASPRTPRHRKPHEPHPLARPVRREPGPVRVAGLSTTVMDRLHPRYSGSEELLAQPSPTPARRWARRPASSASASCSSAPARATTRRARRPAPGPARSRRWTPATSSTACTKRSCTGPT